MRMRIQVGLGWGLSIMLFLVGCSSTGRLPLNIPLGESKPIPPRVVSMGDVLGVGFFLNPKLPVGHYKIGVGDLLKVDVAEHPELSRDDVSVLPDGRISLTLIGSFPVVGKTVDEVSTEVANLYMTRRIKDVKVMVAVTRAQQRVKLLTDPEARGVGSTKLEYRIYDEPFLELPFIGAVAVGRPLSEVRRDIREAYEREFGEQLKVTVNLISRVQENIFVLGEVKKPGGYPIPSGQIPMVNAIATAGGFEDSALREEVLVIRFQDDGSYVYWTVNLDDPVLPAGPQPAFPLKGNDVVFVPKTTIAKVDVFVDQYIRKVIPFVPSGGIFYALPTN